MNAAMELSATTLQNLQDEAYAALCREAVEERLGVLEAEKATIASTRPPFGLLARRETRDAFTRSMRTALDNEAALRGQLARLDAITDWLRPLIRNGVSAYLAEASPEYCGFLQADARLYDWERAIQNLPDLLLAFARDLRNLRTATTAATTLKDCASELADLHAAAGRLERLRLELHILEQTIGERTAGIRLPALPNLQHLPWLARLVDLPPPQLAVEAARVETEVRTHLADEATFAAGVAARLQAAHDICSNLAENALEQYWNQLRSHARLHYVEERSVDEVLEMLTQRYIDANLQRQREQPFLGAT